MIAPLCRLVLYAVVICQSVIKGSFMLIDFHIMRKLFKLDDNRNSFSNLCIYNRIYIIFYSILDIVIKTLFQQRKSNRF